MFRRRPSSCTFNLRPVYTGYGGGGGGGEVGTALYELGAIKEVLYHRWNECHLRAYFESLMILLQT